MSALAVERSRADYVVAAAHPDPAGVRWRLDGVFRNHLGAACAAELDGTTASGIWFVRELDIEVELDLEAADDVTLAGAWARAIGRRLADFVSSDGDVKNVAHFAHEAALLAAFVDEIAKNGDWREWPYGSFESLWALPAHLAVREALTREPVLGRNALALLAGSGRVSTVAKSLGESAVLSVLRLCFGSADPARSAAAAPENLTALLHVASAAPPELWFEGEATAALVLAATALGETPAIEPALLPTLALALVRARAARDDSAGRMLLRAVGGAGVEVERFLEIAAAPGRQTGTGKSKTFSSAATSFGGVSLVIPALLDLGLESVAKNPEFRADVLALTLGAAEADGARGDAAVQLLTGEAQEEQAVARNPQAELADALLASGRAPGRLLSVEAACGLLLVRDVERDEWLGAPASAQGLTTLIADVAHARGSEPLLLEAADEQRMTQADRLAVARFLARRKPADAELGHYLVAGDDPAAALVARAAARGLAARLSGLAWSSARHLRDNVLAGSGTVSGVAGEIEIHLSPRPLDIVLRLAGIDGCEFAAPWLPGRTVTIRLASD